MKRSNGHLRRLQRACRVEVNIAKIGLMSTSKTASLLADELNQLKEFGADHMLVGTFEEQLIAKLQLLSEEIRAFETQAQFQRRDYETKRRRSDVLNERQIAQVNQSDRINLEREIQGSVSNRCFLLE